MNSIQALRFGLASATTFSILYVICALAVLLFPDGTLGFFNSWFHGLDLALLKPPGGRPLTFSQFLYGLFNAALTSFILAWVMAAFYNLFSRTRP
jgi:hypothetical protein